MYQHVSTVYFSPTGNSKKTVAEMAKVLGREVESIDITVGQPKERHFTAEDFVIFGAPVYAGRIPTASLDRFAAFSGSNTPCILVTTYGNRDYDDALLELSTIVSEHGFRVIGAAAVIGQHTYGEIAVGRPNAQDLAEDRSFAEKIAAKGSDAPAISVPGNFPYRDGGRGGSFHPLTADNCVHCGLCVRNCPVQAIAGDCKTISDKCISCFRCIRNCPVHAKNMNEEHYLSFAKDFSEKLKEPLGNEYFF